jgi:hypothetical protein
MRSALPPGLAAALLTAALLTGCGNDDTGTTVATPAAEQAAGQPASPAATAEIVGLLLSADQNQVVIIVPGGNARTFLVRPEDAPRLGIRHLASHAGLTDIGFRITYRTIDAKDYVIAAEETAPPQ